MDAEKALRKHLNGANLLTAAMKREMCRTARRTAWLLQWNQKGLRILYTCCGRMDTNEKRPLKAQGEISHRRVGDCPFCKARVEYLDCNKVKHSDLQENWHIWYRRSKLEPQTLMVIGAWCGVHLYRMKGVEPELREEAARRIVPEVQVCEVALIRWGGGVQSWSADLPMRWSGWYNRYVENWRYRGTLRESRSEGMAIKTMAKDINGAGWRVEHFESFDTAIQGTRWEKVCRALNVGYCSETIFRLGVIARRPQLEYMLVGGLKKLACEAVRDGSGAGVNWRAKRQDRLLPMLDSNERARLRGMPPERVNSNGLRLIRIAKKHRQTLKLEDAMRLGEECSRVLYQQSERTLAGAEGERFGVKKIVRYWQKQHQMGLYSVENMWVDHLRVLRELECEETDANVFPKNLREAHQEMIKRLKVRRDKGMELTLRERAGKVSDRFRFTACGLVLEPYKDANEIIKDGSKLNICIASNGMGYMQRYAEGRIVLASLRRVESPEESFHACEFSTAGQLLQCRGHNNSTFEDEEEQIRAFWKEYNKEKRANVQARLTIVRRKAI